MKEIIISVVSMQIGSFIGIATMSFLYDFISNCCNKVSVIK